jgi:hypothetical protein
VGNPYFPRVVIVILVLILIGSLGYVLWEMNHASAKNPAVAKSTDQPADPSSTDNRPKPDFQKLKGRWLRPDGGYIVQVANVSSGGAMEVSYSNPKPIHVSRSEASWDGIAMKVFIELRDVNYPGSTYNLAYIPDRDELQGIYYQAAIRQEFEVVFVRTE